MRFYNFYFKSRYIPDNERNRQILDYLLRVAEDSTVQPETPTEIFFENSLQKDYEREFDEPWENYRQYYATDIAYQMLQYYWIEEKNGE